MTQLRHPPALPLDRLSEPLRRADRVVMCLDFDGTLAPIRADPAAVALDERVRRVLRWIADVDDATVAIVSGRSLDDLQRRVDIPGVEYAGNHGLEIHRGDERWIHPAVRQARPAIVTARDWIGGTLDAIPGAFVEDKYATLAVHYRAAPDHRVEDVVAIVRTAVANSDALRLETGKAVVQVRPAIDWDKGDAVGELVPIEDGTLVMVIGDDRTDVDAFERLEGLPVASVAIGVGDPGLPTDLTLPDPDAVATVLRWVATHPASPAGAR